MWSTLHLEIPRLLTVISDFPTAMGDAGEGIGAPGSPSPCPESNPSSSDTTRTLVGTNNEREMKKDMGERILRALLASPPPLPLSSTSSSSMVIAPSGGMVSASEPDLFNSPSLPSSPSSFLASASSSQRAVAALVSTVLLNTQVLHTPHTLFSHPTCPLHTSCILSVLSTPFHTPLSTLSPTPSSTSQSSLPPSHPFFHPEGTKSPRRKDHMVLRSCRISTRRSTDDL